MKRSPLTRKTPLKPAASTWSPSTRKRLRARSKRKQADDAVYAEARSAALDRAGYRPECHLFGAHRGFPCSAALEVHHIKLRSHGGGHDLDNLAVLCSTGHRWVHANPDAARKIGLYK